MIDKRRLIYLISLFLFITLGVTAFVLRDNLSLITKKITFGDQQSQGASSTDSQNYITVLNDQLILGDVPKSKRGLLEKYCNAIMNGSSSNGFVSQGIEYNPTKSLFVAHVCGYVVPELREKVNPDFKKYVKDQDLNSLKATYPQFGGCENDMDSCKLVLFLGKIFGGIINEYSNIKLANIYGYTDPDAKVEDLVKTFSDLYFGSGVCGSDKEKFYLFKEKIEGLDEAHCSHPKTYKALYDFINNIKYAVSNTKFVNSEELLKIEGGCQSKDMMKCAFSNTDNNWLNFKNIYMNDLMYYNLFISYYIYSIASDPTYQEFEITSDVGKKFDEMNAEIKMAQNEIAISQKAIFQVDRMLRNVYATFPIHIGMMAYQEDVTAYRDALAKIYTPINQLYYKLRNVQDVSN